MPARRALPPPHPALRGSVLGYFAIGAGLGPHIRRMVPDGCVDLVFNLDEARGVRAGAVEPAAAVIGVLTRPAVVERPANAPVIGVTLAPSAARSLLGAPAVAFNDRMVDLGEVWGRSASDLLDELRDHAATGDRTKHLDAVLLRRQERTRPPHPVVAAAVRIIRAHGGCLSVRALRSELGVSERRLERLFREWTGLSPKGLSRIARLQALLRRLQTVRFPVGPCSWAAIAADLGFADQSHMIREVRTLTGLTPENYLRQPGSSGSFNTVLGQSV